MTPLLVDVLRIEAWLYDPFRLTVQDKVAIANDVASATFQGCLCMQQHTGTGNGLQGQHQLANSMYSSVKGCRDGLGVPAICNAAYPQQCGTRRGPCSVYQDSKSSAEKDEHQQMTPNVLSQHYLMLAQWWFDPLWHLNYS
jgi:hypothetical protein